MAHHVTGLIGDPLLPMRQMRRIFSVIALLLPGLCGCSEHSSTASAYKDPIDRLVVGLGIERLFLSFGYVPCFKNEGDHYASVGDERCFNFNRPEHLQG